MVDLLPNVINNVIIGTIDEHHTIQLPDSMNGDKYKTFRKSRGGVFSRDSLAYTRNKPHGEYFLYTEEGVRFIGRIIKEEEALMFHTLHIVDGKIVDAEYMKLKDLEPDEKLTRSVRYIKETNEDLEEETIDPILVSEAIAEDDSETAITSVSLFDE
jgi:hypothetical protein